TLLLMAVLPFVFCGALPDGLHPAAAPVAAALPAAAISFRVSRRVTRLMSPCGHYSRRLPPCPRPGTVFGDHFWALDCHSGPKMHKCCLAVLAAFGIGCIGVIGPTEVG